MSDYNLQTNLNKVNQQQFSTVILSLAKKKECKNTFFFFCQHYAAQKWDSFFKKKEKPFFNYKYEMKEIIINNKIYHLSLEYILGLFEGDGSIYVQLKPNPSHKFGKQIILNWDIHQYVIDVNLLHAISKFFNCGKVEVGRKVGVEESWVYRYRISNQNDILKILLPILKSNDMVLNKRNHDKNLFINICELIQNKEYITFQGQEKIADKT